VRNVRSRAASLECVRRVDHGALVEDEGVTTGCMFVLDQPQRGEDGWIGLGHRVRVASSGSYGSRCADAPPTDERLLTLPDGQPLPPRCRFVGRGADLHLFIDTSGTG
jgi:hypothetical protein